jgi:cystathionine beta-lyase/cystathionine gamma-synthase
MNSSSNDPRSSPAPARHTDTRLATAGHDPASHHGFVNPPVYHVSTVLYPTAEDYVRPSLALPVRPPRHAPRHAGSPAGRRYVSTSDSKQLKDLTADLERGFAALAAATG